MRRKMTLQRKTYADILEKKREINGSSSKLTRTEEKWNTPSTKKDMKLLYTWKM